MITLAELEKGISLDDIAEFYIKTPELLPIFLLK